MKSLLRVLIIAIFLISILTPLVIWFQTNGQIILNQSDNLSLEDILRLTFPLFGLLGFTLIWLQIMLGAFMQPLGRLFSPAGVFKFHIWEGVATIFFVLLHPGLLGIAELMKKGLTLKLLEYDFVSPGNAIFVVFGDLAFFLFLAAVGAALLRNKQWLTKHWLKIHYLNYVVFVLIIIHSLRLGSHTQEGVLRKLWLFYAISFLVAVVYRRIYRVFFVKGSTPQVSIQTPPKEV